jgi:hypothetical protein
MPCPHSLCGAGPSEVAPSVRLPVQRVHLALRRCSQRPSIDRMALDFRQSSFRHVTRVSPSPGFSVFSPLSALPAGSCPLALSSLGKPLTQGSPLNPSHLRWGCCMNYCGAPDAGGSQLQALVRPGLPPAQRLAGFSVPMQRHYAGDCGGGVSAASATAGVGFPTKLLALSRHTTSVQAKSYAFALVRWPTWYSRDSGGSSSSD